MSACPACHATVPETARFCRQCGQPLEVRAATPEPPVIPVPPPLSPPPAAPPVQSPAPVPTTVYVVEKAPKRSLAVPLAALAGAVLVGVGVWLFASGRIGGSKPAVAPTTTPTTVVTVSVTPSPSTPSQTLSPTPSPTPSEAETPTEAAGPPSGIAAADTSSEPWVGFIDQPGYASAEYFSPRLSGSGGTPCGTASGWVAGYPKAVCTTHRDLKGLRRQVSLPAGRHWFACQARWSDRNPVFTAGQTNDWWLWGKGSDGRWDWFPETGIREGESDRPVDGVAICWRGEGTVEPELWR